MKRQERQRVGEHGSAVVKQLFMQHYAKMLRVARTILYDEQESKDVVSDIFVSLLDKGTVLMPDTAEGYLLTSVRNRCFKRIRHELVKLQMEKAVATEQLSDIDNDDERLACIDEFVACRMSEQEQRIFRCRFTHGFSYEEIADAEGISRVAVWKHLSHVLNEIRNHFKK
ncbi:MAG: sigma-70 family RNA polymerase sigma factor [Prevotella sp.]|nr:sigma-70 family RNA polymerase sigma factor [Prevotella sp.]